MPGLLLAALVVVVGTLATLVLDHYMSSAPESVWRWMFCVVIIGGAIIAIFTEPLSSYLKDRFSHPLISTLIIGLFVGVSGAAIWLFLLVRFPFGHGEQTALPPPALSNFTMSVIHFSHDATSHELEADVQFVNNGPIRRTITNVLFTLRTPPMKPNEWQVLGASGSDPHGFQKLTAVDPLSPLLMTYRQKIDDKLVMVAGNIVGLQVHTIDNSGAENFTNVDVMHLTSEPSQGNSVGKVTKRIKQLSLDEPWHSKIASPTPPKSVATPAPVPEIPQTVNALFLSDFNYLLKFNNKGELHAKAENGEIVKIKIAYSVYMDFAARSRFMSIYIASSPATYHACQQVPNFYQEVLKESEEVEVHLKKPGDHATEYSKELTFTGKVYVYHEDDLTLEQLGSLEALYKTKGLLPQFRGQSYAITSWLTKKAAAPTPP